MLKQAVFNNLGLELQAGQTDSVKMNKYSGYSLQALTHTFEVHHNNASALATDLDVFKFATACISKITLQVGASNERYDLGINAHLLRELEVRKELTYNIDKSSGDNKISTFTMLVDFLSVGFQSPKDTIFFNTGAYDHLMTQVVAGKFTGIANCTISKIKIGFTESFKTDVKPIVYISKDDGKQRIKPWQNKAPIYRQEPYTASNSNFEIDVPKNKEISKIIMWVEDRANAGVICTGAINELSIKNATGKKITFKAPVLEDHNRRTLKEYSDADFDGVLVLNLAQGQYSETLNTVNLYANTKLEFDIVKGALTDPVLNIIYETVELA